jgi:hypothetical protein
MHIVTTIADNEKYLGTTEVFNSSGQKIEFRARIVKRNAYVTAYE